MFACDYFDAGRCGSCTLIRTPYPEQLDAKQALARELLDPFGAIEWMPAVASAEAGFRSKAKMVAGGTVDAPTLGILDAAQHGVDLRDCGIVDPAISRALPVLAAFVTLAGLVPYDVPARRGELKHVIVTTSAVGALMVRFVLRSTEALPRLRKHLPELQRSLPRLHVVTANILPEHKAALEGEQEIVLTSADALPLPLGAVTLELLPRSFVQTNEGIARRLYAQGAAWAAASAPRSVWDLYCGVGGFALHLADAVPGSRVTGVEVSGDAVASAARAAAEAGAQAEFIAADATRWALQQASAPDLVLVNPPRRGIGVELAGWLENSGVERVLYSSCNAVSLARDLEAMPSLAPVRAQLFDMFPHTAHFETLVLLERRRVVPVVE